MCPDWPEGPHPRCQAGSLLPPAYQVEHDHNQQGGTPKVQVFRDFQLRPQLPAACQLPQQAAPGVLGLHAGSIE